jgi:hypothetical protein
MLKWIVKDSIRVAVGSWTSPPLGLLVVILLEEWLKKVKVIGRGGP